MKKIPSCDMCGKQGELKPAKVENTILNLCSNCQSFGEAQQKPKYTQRKSNNYRKPKTKEEDKIYIFISGFGKKVKQAREALKLNQEEMARKLSIKDSLIHQIESEHMQPAINIAKKIEKALNIKIVQEVQEEETHIKEKPKLESKGLTLGDFIKVKKKK
jgi:putative transcription factor